MDFISTFHTWAATQSFIFGNSHGWHKWVPFHFGSFLQLAVIGLLIYFSLRMFRTPTTNYGSAGAEEILRRRYALGEIDEQTYKEMTQDLK